MDRGATLAHECDLCREIGPSREAAADLTLRELDQQCRERLVHGFEVRERDELAAVTQRPADEAMQPLIGLVLVELEVAGRVEGDDAPAAPVGLDAQRDLLGHRAARHERGGRLAKQFADLGLEHRHRATLAVVVRRQLVARERRQLGERVGGGPQAVTLESPRAALAERAALGAGERVLGRFRHARMVPYGSSVGWSGCLSTTGSPSHWAAGAAQ